MTPQPYLETGESQATTAVHLDKGTAKIKLRGAVEKINRIKQTLWIYGHCLRRYLPSGKLT